MAGRDRFLAVFYHHGAPLADGTQKIGYLLYDAVSNCTIAKGIASCISNRETLMWVGFSNDSSLLAFDSTGMLSMLVCCGTSSSASHSWQWMPILDTVGLRKSSDDSHWPITAVDGKLVCVPLKGGTKYPDASRRPVTAVLGFRMPLAQSTLTKTYVVASVGFRFTCVFGSSF